MTGIELSVVSLVGAAAPSSRRRQSGLGHNLNSGRLLERLTHQPAFIPAEHGETSHGHERPSPERLRTLHCRPPANLPLSQEAFSIQTLNFN